MFSRTPSKSNAMEKPWPVKLKGKLKLQAGSQHLETSDAGSHAAIAEAPANQISDDDVEFTNRSKARFERRLRDRWICKVPDHTYCFTNRDGVHISLNEDAMKTWASALVRDALPS
jgi:hypothetical protein